MAPLNRTSQILHTVIAFLRPYGRFRRPPGVLQAAAVDPEFRQQLQAELMPFVSKAPLELQGELPLVEAIRTGELQALVEEVGPALLAQLAQGE